MLAVGVDVFDVTVMDEVAVQPLLPVTVTVYVPAEVIVKASFVPTTVLPSDHEYVPPPVAVTLIEVVVQVMTVVPVLLVMPAVGAVMLLLMVDEAVAVQPFVLDVPVTV
jgi:hypothetical protein